MYFPDLIECPECGFHTHELTQAMSMDDARGKVLMCEACHEDSENDEPFEEGFNF